jgi:hypothetical protein
MNANISTPPSQRTATTLAMVVGPDTTEPKEARWNASRTWENNTGAVRRLHVRWVTSPRVLAVLILEYSWSGCRSCRYGGEGN